MMEKDARDQGKTGAEMAQLCQCSPAMISRCYNGQRNPVPWPIVERHARALGLDPERYVRLAGFPHERRPWPDTAHQKRLSGEEGAARLAPLPGEARDRPALVRPDPPVVDSLVGLYERCEQFSLRVLEQISVPRFVGTPLGEQLWQDATSLSCRVLQARVAIRPQLRHERLSAALDTTASIEVHLTIAARQQFIETVAVQELLATLAGLREGLQDDITPRDQPE